MTTAKPEAMTFRNQLDALSAKFVADYRRRDPIACADAYSEDATLIIPGSPVIRGKIEIAAAFLAAMEAGQDVIELTTTEADADEKYGYAIQIVRGAGEDGTLLLVLRCDDDGMWRVLSEAVTGK